MHDEAADSECGEHHHTNNADPFDGHQAVCFSQKAPHTKIPEDGDYRCKCGADWSAIQPARLLRGQAFPAERTMPRISEKQVWESRERRGLLHQILFALFALAFERLQPFRRRSAARVDLAVRTLVFGLQLDAFVGPLAAS